MKNFNLKSASFFAAISGRFRAVFVLVLVALSGSVMAQSNHTISSFTGSTSDFNAAEKYSANAGQTDFYVTFDQTNLYVGAFRNGTTSNPGDNMAIFLDTDPTATPTTNTGATTGNSFSGVTGTLPFAANYAIHVQYSSNYYELRASSGTSWSGSATTTGLQNYESNTAFEIAIPWSSIGSPDAINLTAWMGYSGGTYSNVPGTNVGGANPTITGYFGTFCVKNGTIGGVNPINVVNTPVAGLTTVSGTTLAAGTYGDITFTGTSSLAGNITLAPGAVITVSSGTTTSASTYKIIKSAITNNTASNGITIASGATFAFAPTTASATMVYVNNITVNGTLTATTAAGTAISPMPLGCDNFVVNNGGAYTHAMAGSVAAGAAGDIPGTTSRTFGATSTVTITKWGKTTTAAPAALPAVSWGNLTINVPTFAGNWYQGGNLSTVQGNLIITASGTYNFSLTNASTATTTTTIGGALTVNGGNLSLSDGSGAASMTVTGLFTVSSGNYYQNNSASSPATTITANGGLTISGTGAVYLNSGGSGTQSKISCNGNFNATSTSGSIVDFGSSTISTNQIDITGTFTKSGTGTFNTASSSAATGFVFNGSGTQTFSYAGANSDYCSYVINSGSKVQLLTGLTLSPSNATNPASTFTVNGTLDCQTYTLTGGGTGAAFTLNSGATLITANTNGVKSGTTGSISTAITSTFNNAANYIFNGTAGQTTNFPNTTMNSLTINNVPATDIVTLNTAAAVNGTLTLTSGILQLGTNNLTMGSSAALSGGSSSSYIWTNAAGSYITPTSTSVSTVLPLGTSDKATLYYTPLTIGTTGSIVTLTSSVLGGSPSLPGSPVSPCLVDLVWNVTTSAATAANVTFNWLAANDSTTGSGTFSPTSAVDLGVWNGSTYVATALGTPGGSYNVAATGVSIPTGTNKWVLGNHGCIVTPPALPTITSFTTSGYTGTTITVNGTNLTGVTSASIGGVAATIGTQSGTSMTLIVGAGATGIISVTNGAGTATSTGLTPANFTYLGYITTATGDWNTAGTWLGGAVPPASAVTTVAHAITCNAAVTNSPISVTILNPSTAGITFGASGALTTTTLTNGGVLAWSGAGTLTIAAGGTLTNNTGATFTYGTGNVVFAGAGTLNGTLSAVTLYNLTINGGATFTTVPTINNNLTINSGGFVTTAPTYGPASTLIYNTTGTYGQNTEWSSGTTTTAGLGVPFNVTIQNSTTLSMAAANHAMAGSLNVITGGLTLNSGSGDIYVGTNWTRAASTTFTPNGRAVFFSGTGTQLMTVSGGETFNYLIVQGSGTLKLASAATVNSSGGLTLASSNGTSTIDLNGQTMTLSGGGNLSLSSGTRLITSSAAGGVFKITSAVTTVTSGGTLSFSATNTTLDLANGFDCGGGNLTTVNGTLQIDGGGYVANNAPIYGGASTLLYNSTGTYGTGNEWTTGSTVTAGTGTPFNVTIQNSTTVSMSAANHAYAGALNITSGGLTLNTGSGDIYAGGNWSRSASTTFTPNSRAVFFAGAGAKTVTVSGGETFNYLLITGGGNVTLASAATVTNTLTLTSGLIILGANNLTLNAASASGSGTSFIATNGTGSVIQTGVTTTPVAIPIGYGTTVTTMYAPITLTGSSTSTNYTCSVSSTVPGSPITPTKIVNLAWSVIGSTAQTVGITYQWDASRDAASFVPTAACEVGIWGGSSYTLSTPWTPTGAGPYTLTATGLSVPASGTNKYVIGNTGCIICSSASTPGCATGTGATTGAASSTVVTWTAPSCYDDVLVVVTPQSTWSAGTPSGSGYSFNLAYGSGAAFGTGFVVYEGTTSSQTVTGLTNGTAYWVDIYTRKGSNWSASCAHISITPSITYCTPSAGTSDGISGVVFNTISNTGTGINSYTDYTATQSTTVTAGTAYNLNVYVNTGGGYTNYQKAWIDWNQDGTFNTTAGSSGGLGEEYTLGTAYNVTNGLSSLCPLSITVPATATVGTTRMRVSSHYNSYTTSCATGIDGEFEDYKIIVIAPVTPTITLTTNNIAAGSIAAGTTNNPIYSFNIGVTTASATLTGLTVTTAGGYASADVTNLKAWYQASGSFNAGTATLLSTMTTPGGSGTTVTFPTFTSQTIASGANGNIFITADLSCSATATDIISINAVTGSNTTFSLGTAGGTPAGGNNQTISAATPGCVTGGAATSGNVSSVVTWTAPSCYDDVLVVVSPQTGYSAGTPSGTGYSGSLTYGSGTAFGANGYVVYEGTSSSQTVTGLTNGTSYWVDIYTRKGSVWSAQCSHISITPSLTYCTYNGTGSSYYITGFTTTGGLTSNISNTGTTYQTGGYYNYSSTMSVNQIAGGTINFTANWVSCCSAGFGIWVDWNNDGTFSSGEQVYVSSTYYTNLTSSFTIPGGTAPGSYRMRIVGEDFNTAPSNPCATSSSGYAEDYTCTVTTPPVPTITSFTPTTLCSAGGQTVTITGTNFSGATAVAFNGAAAASYIVVSSTSVTAVTPASFTAGTITVTTAGGTATSSGSYTVVTNPSITGTLTICGTSTTTLTCTGSTAAASPAWVSGTTGTATVPSVSSNSVTVTGVAAGTSLITYTDNHGCTATATVTDNAAPAAPTMTPASVTLCTGGSSALKATSYYTSAPTTIWSQNFDAGGGIPTGWARTSVISSTYTDFPNTYDFASGGDTWGTNGYGGTGNCLYFYSYIGVGPGYLTTSATDLSSYTSASLTFYIYNSSGTDNIKVYAKQGSGGTYAQVGVTGGYGVYTSWTQITIDMTAYTGAGKNAVYIQFKGTGDNGASNIALDNIVLSGTTSVPNTINWSPITDLYTNSGTSIAYGSGANDSIVYTLPTAGRTYTATAIAANGCTATNTTVVTFNTLSVAPTSLNTSLATICNGGSATLTQTGGSLGTGAVWQWYTDANFTTTVGGTLSSSNASLSVSPTTGTTYYLRAINGTSPCAASIPAATPSTVSVSVAVNTASTAPTSISGGTTVCSGAGTTLTAIGGTLGTGAQYQWGTGTVIGTNPISGANSVSYSVTPTSSQTYWVSVTGTSPCGSPSGGATQFVNLIANQWLGGASGAPTDWNTAANWCSGLIPTATTDVYIPSGTYYPVIGVSSTIAAVAQNISVGTGASITMANSSTLTISAGASYSSFGTFNAGNGTVIFAGAGAVNTTSAIAFNNLTINGTLTNPSSPTTTINGTLLINSGNLTNAPIYGASSTLNYNTGYGRYVEWNATGAGTIGTTPGYPNNVIVQAGTLDVNNTSNTARALAGNLTINSGATLTMNSMTGSLTVAGNVVNNGTLTLSSGSGGDIYVAGNWSKGASATFNPSSRAVFFDGAGVQTVSVTGGGTESFDYLVLGYNGSSSTGGTFALSHSPATNVAVNKAYGLSLYSTNTTSTIELNGQIMTLSPSNGAGNLNLNSGNRFITSSIAGGIFKVTNALTSLSGGGYLTFDANTTVDLQNGFNFGSGASYATLNGTLQMDAGGYVPGYPTGNAPTYGTNSLLLYNIGGGYTAGQEWYANTYTQPGVPYNVTIQNSTAVDNASEGYQRELWGNLTINTGSSFTLNATTYTGHNNDLNIKGNFINSGTFNCSGRLVTFLGSTAQSITGATTFDYLQLNNSTGLTINNDVTVNTQLIFTTGKITTGTNKMILVNSASGAVTGHNSSNYIVGLLKRNVVSSTSYDFPIGTSSNYELGNITFSSGLTGTTNLTASFTPSTTGGTAIVPATCVVNNRKIGSMLNAGIWSITPDAQPTAGTYTVTLNMTGLSNAPASNINVYGTTVTPSEQIGIIKRHDATSPWLGCGLLGSTNQGYGTHVNTTQSISGSNAVAVRSGVPSFSDFGIGIEQNPTYALPVQLIFFTADKKNADGYLTWATASEINNDHFDVERSLDGVTFQKVGVVAGHGNSSQTISYDYTDLDIVALNVPVVYYRLKQVDVDGAFEYTNIVAVDMTAGQDVFHITSVYPNPFSDHFTVSFYTPASQMIKVSVYSVTGALVSEESIEAVAGLNVYTVSKLSQLASGFYTLNVNAGLQNYSYKVIKGE